MSVDDVMREVEQDGLLYQKSGGGVTLSGGEATLQPNAARDILARCKERRISTALETNLCTPWENFQEILRLRTSFCRYQAY
jgi:pyruvate formate lyase activating enzyme